MVELWLFSNHLVANGGPITSFVDHAFGEFVKFVAVPEPSPLALAGAGAALAGGLALVPRRRRAV
jgi:hypothetical protein